MRLQILIVANSFNALARIALIAAITNFYAGEDADTFLVLLTAAYFASAMSDLGLRTRILADTASGMVEPGGQFHNDVLAYRLSLAAIAFIGYLAWLTFQPGLVSSALSITGIAFAIYAVATPMADTSLGILRGRQRIGLDAAIRIVEGVCVLLGALLIGWQGIAIEWVVVTLAIVAVLRQIVTARMTGFNPARNKYRLEGIYQQLRRNAAAGASLLVMTAGQRLPILLAAFLYRIEGIAVLTVTITLIVSTQILSTSVSHYLIPRMIKAGTVANVKDYVRTMLLLGVTGLVLGGLVLLSRPLISAVFNIDFAVGYALLVAAAAPWSMILDFQRFFSSAISQERLLLAVQSVALPVCFAPVLIHDVRNSFLNFGLLYVVYLFAIVAVLVVVFSRYLQLKERDQSAS